MLQARRADASVADKLWVLTMSAGFPEGLSQRLHDDGMLHQHKVGTTRHARKAADAVIAAGVALGAGLQAFSIVGGLLGATLADRWLGVRRLLLWCGLGAVAIFIVGVAGTGVTTAVAVVLTGMFIHGGLYVLYNACAQTYPVQARSTGQGLMIGVGRWGAVLGPAIGGSLLGVLGSKDSFFLVFALITVLALGGLALVRTAAPSSILPAVKVVVNNDSGVAQ